MEPTETIKKTIIIMHNMTHDYMAVHFADSIQYLGDDYVAITEPIEIDAVKVSPDAIIKKQVEAIDSAIEREKSECLARIERMQNKKAELLGLTYVAGDDNNG